jgi:hypothetical protein
MTSNAATGTHISIGVNSGADRFQLFTDPTPTSGRLACFAVQGALTSENRKGYAGGSIGSPPALNTWYHVAGVYESATSRKAYINGSNDSAANDNLNSITPSGVNLLTIGSRFNITIGSYFPGDMAEIGIWNVALTAAEVVSLAKGMTCDKVRPQNLVFYAPLVRDLIDQKGGLAITNNNGATVANHTRVYA